MAHAHDQAHSNQERAPDDHAGPQRGLPTRALRGIPDKTWTAKKRPRPFWPQWLADDNPEVAVWCVGYDAAASRYRGRPLSILESAVGLLALLRSHGVGERPLCFIGHSPGGLLAKRMIVDATHTYPDYRELANQVAGVVFLATPHDGAAIARVLKSIQIITAPPRSSTTWSTKSRGCSTSTGPIGCGRLIGTWSIGSCTDTPPAPARVGSPASLRRSEPARSDADPHS